MVNAGPLVEPLTVDDIPLLHSISHPRLDTSEIEAIVEQTPGLSFWVPQTGEFLLATPWRHRDELPAVHTLWSFQHDRELIEATASVARQRGAVALVMLETGERRRPSFYHQHGFRRIEIIRTYEHMEPEVLARQAVPEAQRFTRLTLDRPELLAAVNAIDHAAFPWFWWNSGEEFDAYLRLPQVEVWAGLRNDEVVSYFGFTRFHHWAHLDRIAVHPARQRLGLGRSAVAYAAERMLFGDARRVGLSTQSSNRISRRLYESLGFRHTRESDYDVFGLVFDESRMQEAGHNPRSTHESGSE